MGSAKLGKVSRQPLSCTKTLNVYNLQTTLLLSTGASAPRLTLPTFGYSRPMNSHVCFSAGGFLR